MKFNLNLASNREVMDKREELKKAIAEYQAMLEVTNDELINRILTACKDSKTEKALRIQDKWATLVSRPSFKDVPLKFAKKYLATKVVVDSKILSPLYKKGLEIPNVTTSDYVMITNAA